jgi:predicted nucleic acid-binding protein
MPTDFIAEWACARTGNLNGVAEGRREIALHPAGRLIGAHDLLIAARALSLGMCLVTDNEREFARVGGLPIENWLRSAANFS